MTEFHRLSEPFRTVAVGRRAWGELRRLAAAARTRVTTRLKYHNTIAVVDGHRFDSRREARRYTQLRLLACAGAIADLELQPEFVLYAPVLDDEGRILDVQRIGSYFGDFRYRDRRTGAVVVEDAKGVRTPLYRFKRKLVEAQYRIRILEV